MSKSNRVAWSLFLFVALWAGFSAAARAADPLPPANRAASETLSAESLRRATPVSAFVGTAGCAAASCHGGGALPGGEYTHWFTLDRPHRQAYLVLFDASAKAMSTRLKRPQPPHEDRQCLACHATSDPHGTAEAGAQFALEYGVGCESCHGAASRWIGEHTQQSWKLLDLRTRAQLGFVDTRDALQLAERCIRCHVGSADAAVDHDLIAAGHPRLNFELSAYQAHHPHHWRPTPEKPARIEDDARFWLIGQVLSAAATLDIFAARADDHVARQHPRVPVDLADYECHACHHDLADESWRRAGPRDPLSLGQPAFGVWYLRPAERLASSSEELLSVEGSGAHKALREVEQLFTAARLGAVDAGALKSTAARGARELRVFAQALHRQPLGEQEFRKLLAWVTREQGEVRGWDDAAQRYLALGALVPALEAVKTGEPGSRAPVLPLAEGLFYPRGYSTPRGFTPRNFEQLIEQLGAELAKP